MTESTPTLPLRLYDVFESQTLLLLCLVNQERFLGYQKGILKIKCKKICFRKFSLLIDFYKISVLSPLKLKFVTIIKKISQTQESKLTHPNIVFQPDSANNHLPKTAKVLHNPKVHFDKQVLMLHHPNFASFVLLLDFSTTECCVCHLVKIKIELSSKLWFRDG